MRTRLLLSHLLALIIGGAVIAAWPSLSAERRTVAAANGLAIIALRDDVSSGWRIIHVWGLSQDVPYYFFELERPRLQLP